MYSERKRKLVKGTERGREGRPGRICQDLFMVRYTEKEGEQLWKRRIHWVLVAFYEMRTWGRRRITEGSGEVLVGSQNFLLGLLSCKCLLDIQVKILSWQLDSKSGAQGEVWESGFHRLV